MTVSPTQQQGVTLVELLITMTIGIALLAGMIQIVTSSNTTFRSQQEQSRVQENGRFTIDLLSRILRQTGFSRGATVDGRTVTDEVALNGCDDETNVATCLANPPIINPQIASATQGDILQVAFDSLPDSPTDCLGNVSRDGAFINTFYVREVNGVSSLFCTSDDSLDALTPDDERLLIDNVETMQVLYGVDPDGDNVANRYLTAGVINSSLVLNMQDVVALRIGLLMTAENPTRQSDDNADYLVAGKTINGGGDRLLKRAYNVTVTLRNRLP